MNEYDSLVGGKGDVRELLDRFNKNPDDPEISDMEKVLLNKIKSVQKEILDLNNVIAGINKEINKKREEGDSVVRQITLKQGESQGYVNVLLQLIDSKE